MITVIIPYFQRTPGILAKALVSIAAQRGCPIPVNVIVVDDGSPAPTEPEIACLAATPLNVQVIKQVNGGPGMARNTGLNNAPPQTRYIAFLDSDDEWMPDHLARAVAALECGYDFYFADFFQLAQTASAFSRSGRINLSRHQELPNLQPGLRSYQGDMTDQIIRGNLIGTPTVVYSFSRYSKQRFRTEFRNAGEDYLFWLELVQQKPPIAFSSEVAVRCGKGVNVYSGSGWGSEQHLQLVHDETRYRRAILRSFALTESQQKHLRSCLADSRVAFVRDLLHRVTHRKTIPLRLILTHLKLDPILVPLAPLIGFKILAKSLRSAGQG
jgi:succinoglycan biosynthesis protein ExoW